MKKVFFYKTNLFPVGIAEQDGFISDVFFGDKPAFEAEAVETPLIKKAYDQINEYLNGKRKTFELPLKPEGTEFQKKVWDALLHIPYGKTESYAGIAAQAGRPKAARAVGNANNRNPIAVVIPCHRVIGANGKLVGYGGGIDIKEKLLELEKKTEGIA